jgi:DNA-binding CsgD family transcriptional regulator
LAEISIAGEDLLVGAYPLINESQISTLTDAERTVLGHILSGSTNKDIAKHCQTNVRTVANQVQSIFDKLHVRSRSELAAQLQNTA